MVQANGTALYYHQDANGNVVALSDTAGNVVERYHYSPFGTPLVCDAAGTENRGDASLYGNRFLFTGREWHAGLKLYDYRARAYSPSLGRFLQADPAGFGGGNHLYRYCGNNPANNVDPSGLSFLSSILNFLDRGGSSSGISPGDRPLTGSSIPGTASSGPVDIFRGPSFSPGASDRVNQGNGGSSVSNNTSSSPPDGGTALVGATTEPQNAFNPGTSVLGRIGDTLGKIWNLPNTILGTAIGLATYPIGMFFGEQIHFNNNAIEFTNIPFGGGGLTIGNTILFFNSNYNDVGNAYINSAPNGVVPLGLHEEAHTYQSQRLGPFFLPAYFLLGGVSSSNPFEQAADRYALGRGGP